MRGAAKNRRAATRAPRSSQVNAVMTKQRKSFPLTTMRFQCISQLPSENGGIAGAMKASMLRREPIPFGSRRFPSGPKPEDLTPRAPVGFCPTRVRPATRLDWCPGWARTRPQRAGSVGAFFVSSPRRRADDATPRLVLRKLLWTRRPVGVDRRGQCLRASACGCRPRRCEARRGLRR